MKNILKYTLLLFLPALAACSNEEDGTMPAATQPQPGDTLELTVSASDFITYGSPDTRATDEGLKTTFDNGDRIGITCLDADGNILANNVPYKYDNGTWSFDSNNGEGKSQCYYDKRTDKYIVYFPYNKDADGVTTIEDLKNKFKPKIDQSTLAAYRASDLMTWSATGTPQKTLTVKLTHAYASVSYSPIEIYLLDDGKNTPYITIFDVNLTINSEVYMPYQAFDGSYHCILPDNFTGGDIRCFYTTVEDKTYNHTMTISSVANNTCYISTPKKINQIYTLDNARIGDFYCKRSSDNKGYLIPGDIASLTNEQKQACVGIVFKVGAGATDKASNYDGKLPNGIHGYVVALQDATQSECYWGKRGVETPLEKNLNADNRNYNGYSNTATIIKTYQSGGDWTYYQAFQSIINYRSTTPAPTTSSNWYLPSLKQLKDIFDFYTSNTLPTKLTTAGGQPFRAASGGYWTSTQRDANDAWFVIFADKGGIDWWSKGQEYERNGFARAILTF